jgi:hypothetical protein
MLTIMLARLSIVTIRMVWHPKVTTPKRYSLRS